MTIPKLEATFSADAARESATVRFSDGRVEHVQNDVAAHLFAACDRIEALEAEASRLRVALEFYGDGWSYAWTDGEARFSKVMTDGGHRARKALDKQS